MSTFSERVSGGAHMDGCMKGLSKPWMTLHKNSTQILNTPIVFRDVFVKEDDACRIILFVKNYADRGTIPIKRFCELKFNTAFEAEVFIDIYKKVLQEIVESPKSADYDLADTIIDVGSTKGKNKNIFYCPPPIDYEFDVSKYNVQVDDLDDYVPDDEDIDDLFEDTQNPYGA
mmetsp:Transcript_12329/g.23108  ORF Transcript_12329/g.23108 Transcript_12329/m.23108 type:complete len:173 (+) Transcript_12329:693-1211(+)